MKHSVDEWINFAKDCQNPDDPVCVDSAMDSVDMSKWALQRLCEAVRAEASSNAFIRVEKLMRHFIRTYPKYSGDVQAGKAFDAGCLSSYWRVIEAVRQIRKTGKYTRDGCVKVDVMRVKTGRKRSNDPK